MTRPTSIRPGRRCACVFAATALAVLSGCGGSDDTADRAAPTDPIPAPVTEPEVAAAPTDASSTLGEYCGVVAELDNAVGMPTVEQIEAYAAVAPPELAGPVGVVYGVLEAADGDFTAVFNDPDAVSALDTITATELEICGGEQAASELDLAAIDPELHGLCLMAVELRELSAPPTLEQMEQFAALVPADQAAPVHLLVDKLTAAEGDFFAILDDPEVHEAFGGVDALEAELCGLPPNSGGGEQDPSVTVIDPTATRVDLVFEDYQFVGELPTAAGHYSFVFQNEGAEPHIAVLVQLEPGVTLEQAFESDGEEGVAALFESSVAVPGDEAVLTADLGSGEWIMLCPIPASDGVPHLEHGMIHTFTLS